MASEPNLGKFPPYVRAVVPKHIPVEKWIRENEQHFLPPVCNKMMHNTQLKVFYVGGPNQRRDYHLEEGEELFYMRKGDMCLKIMEAGQFRDVVIKQGEVFLLPGKIPHSPQRWGDTVGLVIERERLHCETDGLRYFVEGTSESLFERWFYCEDLGTQLGPVIAEFFASEECRTGKPQSTPPRPPWQPDSARRVEAPFSLDGWLDDHRAEIESAGRARLFSKAAYESDVVVLGLGTGPRDMGPAGGETFLWQLRGESVVIVDDNGGRIYRMCPDDTLLVPKGAKYRFEPEKSAMVLSCTMDPENKKRIRT